jgi:hypothetical protein
MKTETLTFMNSYEQQNYIIKIYFLVFKYTKTFQKLVQNKLHFLKLYLS